jgi:hypothetical protein
MRTKLRVATWCVLVCLLAGGFGCGERDDALDEALTLQAPVALRDQLVFVDRAGARAFVLDVAGKHPEAEAEIVDLPHDPTLAVRRKGANNEVLILALGRRATADEDAEPAKLAVLNGDGKLRAYTLGNPFDRLAQSDDGRYALLFKSDSAKRLIDNPNEIAIVDLSKAPKDDGAIDLRTLQNLGELPQSVVFSPTMNIVGDDRRLAIVLSHKNVTLIDLDHLDRLETTVQLSATGDGAVEPAQVAFNPNAPELYVRGAASNDVFVFNLSARPGGSGDDDPPHNDFRPFIDQLGVGGLPSDMTLYQTDTTTRLLVLTASTQQASIVDAGTSGVTNVGLPARASHALLFDAPSPRDREASTRALLYEDNGTTLMFLDLADVEARGSRNVEEVALEQPIAKLIALPEEQRVLVLHPAEGVSVVDLVNRTVSPLSSATALVDAPFDAERHRLWVGPSGQPRVGWLDLTSGDTHELLLDANITTLVPMFDAGRLAVVHGDPEGVGYVTLIDAKNPSRETATSIRGFAIAGLLDRGK